MQAGRRNMVQETGTVEQLQGSVAMVALRKSLFRACCRALGLCHTGMDRRTVLVETRNVLGAAAGDKVRLATRTGRFVLALFLLYAVPLLALIAGAVLGEIVGTFFPLKIDPVLLAGILGLVFMTGFFFIVRVGRRVIPRDSFMPEIIEILPGEECSEEQHGY